MFSHMFRCSYKIAPTMDTHNNTSSIGTIEGTGSPPLFTPPTPSSPISLDSPTTNQISLMGVSPISPRSPLYLAQFTHNIYDQYTTSPPEPISYGSPADFAPDHNLMANAESQYDPDSILKLMAYADGAEQASIAANLAKKARDEELAQTKLNREQKWLEQQKIHEKRATARRNNAALDAIPQNDANIPIPTSIPKIISLLRTRIDLGIYYNKQAFLNLTPFDIPDQIQVILSFGPKFSIPIHFRRNESEIDMLKDILSQLNDIYLAPYEAKTLNIILREVLAYGDSVEDQSHTINAQKQAYLSTALQDTLRLFKETPGLTAAQADKSNQSIVMFTEDYVKKCQALLTDTTTYQPIKWSQSSSEGFQKQNKNLLLELHKLGHITASQIKHVLNEETRIANFYALIKTHKEGQPARPIVNTRSTPGYFISKQLNKMLSPMIEFHKYNIKNSAELIEFLAHIHPAPGEKFFSYDVKSMFTSVSPDMSISAFEKRLAKQGKFSAAEIKFIIKAMRFTIQYSTEVSFNNQLYKQINGLRMGSSCSNICSDVVIEDILDTTFRDIPKPNLFAKYIDDIICLTTEDMAIRILESLNSQHPRIQFEMETEVTQADGTGSINFLDITLTNHHDYSPISTKWYQKSIASGRFLNYLSCHHPQTIYNTAKAFVHNMINVTSPHFLNDIRQTAHTLLSTNNYPAHIIQRIFADIDSTHNPINISPQQQWFQAIQNDSDILTPEDYSVTTQQSTSTATSSYQNSHTFARLAIPYIPNITDQITKAFNSFRPDLTMPTKPANPMKKLYNEHKNPGEPLPPKSNKAEETPPLAKRRRTTSRWKPTAIDSKHPLANDHS